MHTLIAFAICIGLIAFAFGYNFAHHVVRTCLLVAFVLIVGGLTYFAVGVWRELHTMSESAKIPEDTPELRHICAEWLTRRDEPPRMCFNVLDQMRSPCKHVDGYQERPCTPVEAAEHQARINRLKRAAPVTHLSLIESYEEFCAKHRNDPNYVVCK